MERKSNVVRYRLSTLVAIGLTLALLPVLSCASGNTFTTRFTLPEAAVHAAVVVEDTSGQRLDTNGGKLFDLLVHDPDGMPLHHALKRRADEFEAATRWRT